MTLELENMALITAKKLMRRKLKESLSRVSPASIASQSTAALQRLFSLPEYQRARTVSLFMSMPTKEISSIQIVRDSFHKGKKVYIPYIYNLSIPVANWPHSIMDMVQLNSIEDLNSLKRDKYGIPSLDEETIEERRNCFGGQGLSQGKTAEGALSTELDIIVMPGLGFDTRLERLGHGKGYYDFFLQRYLWHTQKANVQMPYLVALALNEQVLPEDEQVPNDVMDYKLDALIMGSGMVLRADGASS